MDGNTLELSLYLHMRLAGSAALHHRSDIGQIGPLRVVERAQRWVRVVLAARDEAREVVP